MNPPIAILACALFAAEAVALGQSLSPALASRSVADFEKVDASPVPKLTDTMRCVQSNAAALPAARVEERYLVYYRRGYCELFGAILTGNSDAFQSAARDFTAAIAAWPMKAPTPPPAGLLALAAIARLEQGRKAESSPDLQRDLGLATASPSCFLTPVMSTAFCNSLVDTARTWLGWLAYRGNEFDQAAKVLEPVTGSVLGMSISGRLAHDGRRLDEAAALYRKALDASSEAEKSPNPDVVTLLGPKLDTAAVHYQLGLAEYARQKYDTAIANLDVALRASPKNSYAIFLRARSKDALRLSQPAIDDYAVAVLTARANNDSSWNVGEAHFYRGVLLYRAKDYVRAEAEFSSAAAARLTEVSLADVSAWRAMTAVAGGACKSADVLESSLNAASRQFPRAEADALAFACHMKQATSLDRLLALEKSYSGRLEAAKLRGLRAAIAAAYADRGVAAEDRKDPGAAVIDYRKAIEWNPANAKARFNLGAIYIEHKKYDLAEAEYRALVDADAGDHEAQYWLAQSILAQRPTPERAAAACELLGRSLAIGDPEKKAQFAKARTAAKCLK